MAQLHIPEAEFLETEFRAMCVQHQLEIPVPQ